MLRSRIAVNTRDYVIAMALAGLVIMAILVVDRLALGTGAPAHGSSDVQAPAAEASRSGGIEDRIGPAHAPGRQ